MSEYIKSDLNERAKDYQRCSICDFHTGGLCQNYEIDQFTSDSLKNHVIWSEKRQAYVCHKCIEAITDCLDSFDENSIIHTNEFEFFDPSIPYDDLLFEEVE